MYWPNIDSDIEHIVKKCENCALITACPPKVAVYVWDTPKGNWEGIHIDHAGPVQNNFLLVVVDAKSKWAEVKLQTSAPTSQNTIALLEENFASHGCPVSMVSDNVTIFHSDEFKTYCRKNRIFQKFTAPETD